HQRCERPPHRGARQVDRAGDVAQGQLAPLAVERLDHPQAARQRVEELWPGVLEELSLGVGAVEPRNDSPLVLTTLLRFDLIRTNVRSANKSARAVRAVKRRPPMLSAELNDRITWTGPRAPGGALMRRYWQPAALVDELAGNRPVKP